MLGLDASETGIEQAKRNASLNGLSDIVSFECADVFENFQNLKDWERNMMWLF